MKRIMLWLAALVFAVGCGDGVVSPDPPTIPPIPPIEPPAPTEPPRVDRKVDIWNARGCTAFGMAALTKEELVTFVYHAQSQGCEVFRVGAQTDGWAGTGVSYLEASVGPQVLTPEWEFQLRQLLDVTARIEGVGLQLIPTFTHKHEPFHRNMEIAKRVAAIVKEGNYKHVVWEAWNEVKHPITHKSNRDMKNIKKMLVYLRDGTDLPVGTDYDVSAARHDWVGAYPRTLLPYVDYVAFHPPRNDVTNGCENIRPDYWELRKTVAAYGKPVWIDEPMCYISDESIAIYGVRSKGHYALCAGGNENKRKKVIGDYMWDTEQAGAVWFTHALWLFECRRLGWLPQ